MGSEIVGVVSLESLVNSLEYYIGLEHFDRKQILETHLLELEAGEGAPTAGMAFLEQLASSSPAPGGGSAAAHTGAVAAALVAMVGRLTAGREKYADVENRMLEIISQAERLRSWMQEAVQLDEDAFTSMMAARKLPKNTPDEQAARTDALRMANAEAAAVPLKVAQRSLDVLGLALEVAEKGNVNAITDAASAALMSRAALKGAGLNVKINAASAQDLAAGEAWKRQLAEYENQAEALYQQVCEVVKSRSGIQVKPTARVW